MPLNVSPGICPKPLLSLLYTVSLGDLFTWCLNYYLRLVRQISVANQIFLLSLKSISLFPIGFFHLKIHIISKMKVINMHPFNIYWLGSCEAPSLAYFSNPRSSLLLSWHPALQLSTTVEDPKSTVLPCVSMHWNKRQEITWSWMNRENYLGCWFSRSWFQSSWDPAVLPTPEFCEINTPVILPTNFPLRLG